MASVNPQFSIANVITIILTFVVALTAFNTVEGQVEKNKKSIDEAKVATNEMQQSVHTLTIDVALLKRDAENAAQQREEIKANQTRSSIYYKPKLKYDVRYCQRIRRQSQPIAHNMIGQMNTNFGAMD